LRRFLLKKLYNEKKRFEQMVPSEYKSLRELMEEVIPSVRLVSGDFHVFDRRELEQLADDIPWYLHGLVRLPWVFSYRRLGFKHVYKLEAPGRWAARALNYILEGDVGGEVWEVDAWRFPRLLRRYKSLILVILRIDIPGGES